MPTNPININLFDGPIAGQSMTASPDSKMAWDGPPKYSGLHEATEAIFLDLLEPENLEQIIPALQEGVPISDLTQLLLMSGYSSGQFNPDLMFLLIEPVMYMLMAIADRFGIPDVKIYRGEEEDEELPVEQGEEAMKASLSQMFNSKEVSPKLRSTLENSDIAQKLADVDVESIMAKPKEEVPQEPMSLLQQGN